MTDLVRDVLNQLGMANRRIAFLEKKLASEKRLKLEARATTKTLKEQAKTECKGHFTPLCTGRVIEGCEYCRRCLEMVA